jgi:hypothetical protein
MLSFIYDNIIHSFNIQDGCLVYKPSKISSCHCGVYEQHYILGCCAVQSRVLRDYTAKYRRDSNLQFLILYDPQMYN